MAAFVKKRCTWFCWKSTCVFNNISLYNIDIINKIKGHLSLKSVNFHDSVFLHLKV